MAIDEKYHFMTKHARAPHPWSHLDGLAHLGVYAAPADTEITPYTIPARAEVVELLTGGAVDFVVDGVERRFGAGTLFWHREGEKTVWKTPADAPYRCTVFHFRVTARARPAPRVSVWRGPDSPAAFTRECLERFHARPADRDPLALYAYAVLLRQATVGGIGDARPPELERLLAFLARNDARSVHVDELCRHAGTSRARLFRLFHQHVGVTPHRYQEQRRMARARLLLADDALGIKEIAARCGFSHLEVFYRRFKTANGLTPLAYRRRQRERSAFGRVGAPE